MRCSSPSRVLYSSSTYDLSWLSLGICDTFVITCYAYGAGYAIACTTNCFSFSCVISYSLFVLIWCCSYTIDCCRFRTSSSLLSISRWMFCSIAFIIDA